MKEEFDIIGSGIVFIRLGTLPIYFRDVFRNQESYFANFIIQYTIYCGKLVVCVTVRIS